VTLELAETNLPKKSWVKMGQVRTLSIERIGKRLTRIAPGELELVLEGLKEIIGA
jgi:mRNA interferase MazF